MMKLIATAFLFFLLVGCSVDINGSSNYYLINGRNHIFKVFAPQLWANDDEKAKSLGIASFFIPAQPFIENPKNGELYIYAQGWDKANKESTFENFIQEDRNGILKKFKNVKITKKDFNFSKLNNIKNAAYFVIENIPGRYKEDCLFLETDSTIVNIVYSAANKELYDLYKDDFDKSLTKFEFLSSDPIEIKKILEQDREDRGY